MLELTYYPSSCVSTCIFPVTWLCSIRCGLLVYESLQFDSNEPEGDRSGGSRENEVDIPLFDMKTVQALAPTKAGTLLAWAGNTVH